MAGLPKLESCSVDFFLNIFEGECGVTDKKYYLHANRHQGLIYMNIILLTRILIEIFFQYKFEKWKNDVLSDFFSLSVKIFLSFFIYDFDMFYYFCFIRSVDDLSLI